MAVSNDSFRQVLSRFATGVTIITLKNDAGVHGLTVNSFASVSLDPPLILVCIQRNVSSHAYFSTGENFVVNLLCKDQKELSNRFANPELSSDERFEGVAYELAESDVPILSGNLGHLECKVSDQIEAGDHTIFLGAVSKAQVMSEDTPLLFFQSRYLDV